MTGSVARQLNSVATLVDLMGEPIDFVEEQVGPVEIGHRNIVIE